MAFSLSMNTTTLRTLPKVSRVSGFSTTTRVQLKTRRSGRLSLIVAQSSSDNGSGSVKVKYDKVLKEMEPIPGNYVNAEMKRVKKYKEYVTANEKAKSARNSWVKKGLEVNELEVKVDVIVGNTSSTSEDVETARSLRMKYEEARLEMQTLASNVNKAVIKRAELWEEHAAARKDARLSWHSWINKEKEVTELQSQLGISVENSSSSSENDGFACLMVKYEKVLMELEPAERKYKEAKMKRIFVMKYADESGEEMLAWESWEMTRLKVLELQMQMYILRPGIKFELRK